jgi:hypothetical protein
VVAVAATGELLSTRSGRGVQARSVGKHASYVVTRHDRRAHGHAQDTTHPWSRARLRVSSVAVMACHGKVQPIEPATPNVEEWSVPRILSGVQPTGNTHLGNYVGARRSEQAGA